MQDYYSSYTRYEFRAVDSSALIHPYLFGPIGATITPVKIRKEMVDKKLTIVRVTEVNFPRTYSSLLTSTELGGWGSCTPSVTDNIPPTRDQLIFRGYIRPSVTTTGSTEGYKVLSLDWAARKSVAHDQYLISKGLPVELPAGCVPQETEEQPLTTTKTDLTSTNTNETQ